MPTTYLGRTVVPIPSYPPAPASIEFSQVDAAAASLSPFTFQQQVQRWAGSYRKASVTMPAMTDTNAQAWVAFLVALNGIANCFQFGAAFAAAYPLSIGSRYWCLTSNERKWSINSNRAYGMQFEIREVL
jgi:hypothetical protein